MTAPDSFMSQVALLLSRCDERDNCIQQSEGIQTAGALKDVKTIRNTLALAERMHAHDESTTTICDVRDRDMDIRTLNLPLIDSMSQPIRDVQELREKLNNSSWTKADDDCLYKAVLNECRRIKAYELKSQRHDDPIGAIATMSVSDILQYALPNDMMTAIMAVNWQGVAQEVASAPSASAKTGAACQTRWLMVLRADLTNTAWSQEELKALKESIERQASATDHIDWHIIAREVGNGRLPIDCIIAYQRRICPEEYHGSHLSHPVSGQERMHDEVILQFISIYGFNWPLIGERLNRCSTSISDRFLNALDTRLNIGVWNESEIEALKNGVQAAVGQEELANAVKAAPNVKIEWNAISQSNVGSRTWRQCRDKWNQIAREFQREVAKEEAKAEQDAGQESRKNRKKTKMA
ncbi:unnamed protein product [Sympodiomycopsis kandeliae]